MIMPPSRGKNGMEPMPDVTELLNADFGTLSDLIATHARQQGERLALIQDDTRLTYAQLDAALNRVASGLHRDGVKPGQAVAIVAISWLSNALVFLGALRAGCVPAPIAPSGTPEQIAAMIRDCAAPLTFADSASMADALGGGVPVIALEQLDAWLPQGDVTPHQPAVEPGDPFNMIYSSGTTGMPKGIVQSHAMRWQHFTRLGEVGYGTAVTLIATPLYSNTTLVSFLPTLAWGGTVVLMKKFDARAYLDLAQQHRATHTMLVPVQYQRIMAMPDFDRYDLSSFLCKFCTSAPFAAELKGDVVRRWPGALIEFYGMTEGGGTCRLNATQHPDKLHTVGRPAPGSEILLIDDQGRVVPNGEIGEVVGRSAAMMNGYHGRPEATREAEWHDADGNRYIRHGDIGRFDQDGFLTLLGRAKDMIISGGFNIYPADIEEVLNQHPQVAESAVIGVESERWGETPVGIVVASGEAPRPDELLEWANARLGKVQRLSDIILIDELPRSAIGKILKRELRDSFEVRRASGEPIAANVN